MANLNQPRGKGAKAYQEQKIVDRNALVVKYAPLVKRVASHLKARLPSYVDVNDLMQSGMIGLIDAIQNYKNGQGAAFETYAAIRIRGSIIDELRQSDWTPRSVHQNTRAIRDAVARLNHKLGRLATDKEVAAELNVDINRYHQMVLESNTSQVMGIEDTGLTDDVIGERTLSEIAAFGAEDKLFESINSEQFKESLARSIERLPVRERKIVTFYYDQELNLREIGLIMGISESRTCQILSQALMRLRRALDDWSYSSGRVTNSGKSKDDAKAVKRPARKDLIAPGAEPKAAPLKKKSDLFDDEGLISTSSTAYTSTQVQVETTSTKTTRRRRSSTRAASTSTNNSTSTSATSAISTKSEANAATASVITGAGAATKIGRGRSSVAAIAATAAATVSEPAPAAEPEKKHSSYAITSAQGVLAGGSDVLPAPRKRGRPRTRIPKE